MDLEAPQIIWLVLAAIHLFITGANNGKPRTDNYEFGSSVANRLLIGIILYWGGFFG